MIDAGSHRRQRIRNGVQAVALLAGMALIFGAIAWLLFGRAGVIAVAAAAAVIGALRPRVPARWILRRYGARPLPEHVAPELHRTVAVLAYRAGLPRKPALYYVASPMANAFATGTREDAVVAVTDGILRRLTGRQLVGVLGHEISHVRAGDMRITNLSDGLARLTLVLSDAGMVLLLLTLPLSLTGDLRPLLAGLLLSVLPTVSALLQMALSRSREYDADLQGAVLTGDPEGLASALEVLERRDGSVWERLMVPRRRAHDPTLLRSHPPTAERTRRLRELTPSSFPDADDGDAPWPLDSYPAVTAPPRHRPPGICW
jgi:heat shock protein HtpX